MEPPTDLFPFQKTFVRNALDPDVDTACLSIPRGNGKSWLAAYILSRALSAKQPYVEFLLCAASIEQARIVYRFIRQTIEPTGGWRFIDSATRLAMFCPQTNTKLRVLSSKAKTAMGIVGCPLIVCDEPGSWETIGGELMYDAIQTAMGKPGSPLKAIYIGTLWPSHAGWWPELVSSGSHGSTYVQHLQANKKQWDLAPEIRRVNPLKWAFQVSRKKLLSDRDEARGNERFKSRFMSACLNLPTRSETDVLITVDDWRRAVRRRVKPRGGDVPIVGVDMGGRRAWSAAVAVWPDTLRVEAFACCGGEDDVAAREKADLQPRGTYAGLVKEGSLLVARGKRTPPMEMLVNEIFDRWGGAQVIVADRFRIDALEEEVDWRAPIEPRTWRWSDATSDIEDLSRLVTDGGLNIFKGARKLLGHSIAQAVVKEDDSSNVRLVKVNSKQRDDVAAALVLAVGAIRRHPVREPLRVM